MKEIWRLLQMNAQTMFCTHLDQRCTHPAMNRADQRVTDMFVLEVQAIQIRFITDGEPQPVLH